MKKNEPLTKEELQIRKKDIAGAKKKTSF